MKQIIFLLFLLSCTAVYAQQQDSVTIHGRVTDYNGQPIDSASVWWQNPQFNDIIEAITDKDGHYTARIPKGKYQSAASIYLPSYAHIAMKSGLPETEHRLDTFFTYHLQCFHNMLPDCTDTDIQFLRYFLIFLTLNIAFF